MKTSINACQIYSEPGQHATRQTETMAKAEIFREFERLMETGTHSMRSAAAELGKSASYFSGGRSLYGRYKREGIAGLLPKPRKPRAKSQELERVPVPDWFISAICFFYLLSFRKRPSGSMPEAVRRTITLPAMPSGWTQSIHRRFLKSLCMDTMPKCPPELIKLILQRQAAGKQLLTPTIASQIKAKALHHGLSVNDICHRYDELKTTGVYSLNTAAVSLGKSGSFFSGSSSTYARVVGNQIGMPRDRAAEKRSPSLPGHRR